MIMCDHMWRWGLDEACGQEVGSVNINSMVYDLNMDEDLRIFS